MIPKTIWQTYETSFEDLPIDAKKCINTWNQKNPNWEYKYMNSKQREDFVLDNFGSEWHNVFTECSLNIVRANIWRCMILYVYGGVYCDLDTICNEPIEYWLKEKYSMTIAKDDDGNAKEYCINVIASKPNNQALLNVLNVIKNNILNNNLVKDNVIELTGETVWFNVLGNKEKKYNIYCYKKGSNMFNGVAVKHLGTSKKWNNKEYKQWTEV
jgi:mannosyltransferase OCH1-like enzyme